MARIIYRLVYFYFHVDTDPHYAWLLRKLVTYVRQLSDWILWWFSLCLLWMSWVGGRMLYPVYESWMINLDMVLHRKIRKRSMRIRNVSTFRLLSLPSAMCVFTEIHNVHAQDLVFLSRPRFKYKNSIPYNFIEFWNKCRSEVGSFPPNGWPMRLIMSCISVAVLLLTVWQGYKRIKMAAQLKNKKHSKVFQSRDTNNGAKSRLEVFDGDSDTIIVDNSANCIIWRHKKNFSPDSYTKLKPGTTCGVSSAVGKGSPVGVGDLNIGWKDDDGKYHKFLIPQVFHIPDSPVNILGVGAFSKAIGDYNIKGTRINSSGQDSIFSWDEGKYSKTFRHSESDMPEMPVNDGFAAFHRFCNFIDAICPISQQCYHTKSTHTSKSIGANYECGEEITYKNADHVERGIIESIKKDE